MDTVVADACLVITFGNEGRLDLLTSTSQRRFVVPPESAREVSKPPASGALAAALATGLIATEAISVEDPDEQNALLQANAVPAFRDRGDAEVLALAASRGWIVGSDDLAMRNYATRAIGAARVAGTLDILVWAVRERRLPVSSAEELLNRLDVGPAITARLAESGRTLSSLI